MNRLIFFLCSLVGSSALAQHPFYLQIFDEGKLAMAAGDWQLAARDIEIAAFGFLDKEELLAEAYVRLVLIHKALDQTQLHKTFLRDVNRILENLPNKPAGLADATWDEFLILSGRKAPPRPAIPKHEAGLVQYVVQYSDSSEAWLSLISLQKSRSRQSVIRQTLAEAMGALPENPAILSLALSHAILRDKGRGAEILATKLLILEPDSDIANEFLGGLAVGKRDWAKAQAHFALVQTPQLPKTGNYRRQLARNLAKNQQRETKQATANQNPKTSETSSSPIEVNREEGGNIANASGESQAKNSASTQLPGVSEQAALQSGSAPVVSEKENTIVSSPSINETVIKLERQARESPGDRGVQFDLVDGYVDQGALRKAKKLLARLAKTYKDDPRYAETYAHYQYARGNFQTNIENLSGFKKPKGAIAYYLGMSYYRLGQLDHAKAILSGVQEDNYFIPKGLLDESEPTQQGQNGGGQVKTLSSFSQAEALNWLAAMTDQGNWAEVEQSMGEILARYPTNPSIRYFHGRLLMAKGAYDEAMPVFIQLVSEGYGENEIFYYAGIVAENRGNSNIAKYLLERAQANDSKFVNQIQAILQKLKNQEEPK